MNNIGDTNTLLYKIEKEDSGIELKEVLYNKINLSGRLLRKVKRQKNIFVNDNNLSLNSKLRTGDIVKVIMAKETNQFKPQPIPITIAYEDMDLLIINKQPNIVVHPTKGHIDKTIANGIANHLVETNENYKIRFINRLDMDTSGLLMVAKNPFTQQIMSKQMDEDKIEKKYLTVVKGVVEKDFGTIDAPIGREDDDPVHRKVIEGGQRSITHFEVLKRMKDATLLRIKLETGRTHQIRVHMKYQGHPLIGDSLYGYIDERLICRQALHAESLKFYQPRTGEEIFVNTKIPEDMRALINRLST